VTRVVSVLGVGLIGLWVVAHLLYLGPIRAATETLIAWLAGIIAVSAVIAGVTVLAWGVVHGGTSPAWLRFVGVARTLAAAIGAGLVVVGLLHYRDTEPRSEIGWLVAGVVVLAGALVIHAWLAATERRNLN
jgi:hypothetical protein